MDERNETPVTRASHWLTALCAFLAGAGVTATAAAAPAWGPVGPVAYGDAQIEVPLNWPVVDPGTSTCNPSAPSSGVVVLLGANGQSAWCPTGSGAASHMAGTVRLGPMPTAPLAGTRQVRNGIVMYRSVLQGPRPATVYVVPALQVELALSGADQGRVVDSLRPSVRQRALAQGPLPAPTNWHKGTFAGLTFAAPPTWAVQRTPYVYDCALQADSTGLLPPPHVELDNDTNDLALPCPLVMPPRTPVNGLVLAPGSPKAPNVVPARARQLRLDGLQAFVDPSAKLGTLVLFVRATGRKQLIRVVAGLGDPLTVERILGSLGPAS
jgi:hypothetical protein